MPAKPVNLAKMMVGSEGTLGIVLEAKLRLVPLPKAKAVMVIHVRRSAGIAGRHARDSAAQAFGRRGDGQVDSRQHAPERRARPDPQHVSSRAIRRRRCASSSTRIAKKICRRAWRRSKQDLRARSLGYAYHSETDLAAQAQDLESARSGAGSFDGHEGRREIDLVRRRHGRRAGEAARFHRALSGRSFTGHGTTAGIYAHASVGCLHVRPVINMKTEEGVRKFEAIAQDVADLVLEFGGALSGEHGDGLVRSPFMRQMFGAALYEAFREIKRTFDPLGIFNPGKIVDAPPMTANLRFGAGYQTPNPATFFDYSEYGGMGGAVEMCSGVGACRKKLAGTMCPSYMATREEAAFHARPRQCAAAGDGGRLGEAGLGDDGVYEVLDLCLECRACKAECPVGVDMARFKSEFLADYWQRHGTPLKARALGNVHQAVGMGQPVRSGLELDASQRAGAVAERKAAGHRPPAHAAGVEARTFARWLRADPRTAPGRRLSRCSTIRSRTTTIPRSASRRWRFWSAAAAAVNVVRPGCCGRPLISQGLLAEARAQAETLVEGLFPIAQRGEKILFCEPSCLSAVKEDAPSLLRGELQQKARR